MNKVETIPAGRILYHGAKYKLNSGYSSSTTGVWFTTSSLQAVLHVADRTKGSTDPMHVYLYKTIRPLRVLKFDSKQNMNNWAVRSGFKIPENTKTFAFTNKNFGLAKYLCDKGEYDGWWFPKDQNQVMLCKPRGVLRFMKVLEVVFPYGKPSTRFNKGNNKAEYVVDEVGPKHKYKFVNKTLNSLRNITNVPKNSIYVAKSNSKTLYFNSSGKQLLTLNQNKIQSANGFNINGKKFYAHKHDRIDWRYKHKLVNRIRETMNVDTSRKWKFFQYKLLTLNQKQKLNNYNKAMEEYYNKISKKLPARLPVRPNNNNFPPPPSNTIFNLGKLFK
jgi:hypothetical protein